MVLGLIERLKRGKDSESDSDSDSDGGQKEREEPLPEDIGPVTVRRFLELVTCIVLMVLGAVAVCAGLVKLTDAVMSVIDHPFVVLFVLGAALILLQDAIEWIARVNAGRFRDIKQFLQYVCGSTRPAGEH